MLGASENALDRKGLWANPSSLRRFQRRGRTGLVIAVAALSAGCLERPIVADAQEPPGPKHPMPLAAETAPAIEADLCDLLGPDLCTLSESLTVRSLKDGSPALLIVYQPERNETAKPASAATAPPGPGRAEIPYEELRARGRRVTGDALLTLDQELRDAEEEFPLDFRFSYERATLAVFGKHEHHEAFRRLRRAAEKAIETQTSDAMLEMLRRDGERNGPFWKLARGHRPWNAIHEALEHRDRQKLWHDHGHEEPVQPDPPRASSDDSALDRLRLMRERIGMQASEHRALRLQPDPALHE